MSPITQAIAETLVSANTKKVAEKRRTDEVAAPRPGAIAPNALLRNSMTTDRSLGFVKTHLQTALDTALTPAEGNRSSQRREHEAYRESATPTTPQTLADTVFSRVLGHFSDFRNARAALNNEEALIEFIAKVRETYGMALREIINVMGGLGVMTPEIGRMMQEVDQEFKSHIKEIEPLVPETMISSEEMEAIMSELDM